MYQHRGETGGRRAAHVEDTRRALLDAAREEFATNGFQATRTEEIVQRAGLTRGALYHHFRDKEDLFREVFEEVSAEVVPRLFRRSTDPDADAWSLFRANSEIYLDAASRNRAYRQIVLIDGPAVMGWRHWSERGSGPTGAIVDYLTQGVEQGVLDPLPVEPLAHLLWSLGVGSAMYVAHADDPVAARREIGMCNDRLLAGLATGGSGAGRAKGTRRKTDRTGGADNDGVGLLDGTGVPGKVGVGTRVRRRSDRASGPPVPAPAVPPARRRAAAHRRSDEAGGA